MNKYSKSTQKTLTKKDLWLIYFMIFMQYGVTLYGCKSRLYGGIIVVVSCVFPLVFFFVKIFKKDVSTIMVNKYFGILGVYSAFVSAVLLSYQFGNSISKMIGIFCVLSIIILIFILSLDIIFGKSLEKMKGNKARKTVGYSFYALAGLAGMYSSRYLTKIGLNIHFEIIMSLLCFVFTAFHSFTMKYRQLLKSDSTDIVDLH